MCCVHRCYDKKYKIEDMATVLGWKILSGLKDKYVHQTDKQGNNTQIHVNMVQTTLVQHFKVRKL